MWRSNKIQLIINDSSVFLTSNTAVARNTIKFTINEKVDWLKLTKSSVIMKNSRERHVRHRYSHFFTAEIRFRKDRLQENSGEATQKNQRTCSVLRYCGALEQDLRELSRQSPDWGEAKSNRELGNKGGYRVLRRISHNLDCRIETLMFHTEMHYRRWRNVVNSVTE